MEIEELLAELKGTELGEIMQIYVDKNFPPTNHEPIREGETPFAETTRFEKACISWLHKLKSEEAKVHLPSLLNLTFVEKWPLETLEEMQKRALYHTLLWRTIAKRLGPAYIKDLGIRAGYLLVKSPKDRLERYTEERFLVNIRYGLGGEIV